MNMYCLSLPGLLRFMSPKMTFGEAVEALKNCKAVKRATWNDSAFIKIWRLYDESVILRDNDLIYEAPYSDMIADDWMIID